MLLSLLQLSLGLKWDIQKPGLLVTSPFDMVATPSVAISRLQLACSVEPFANEARVVGLIPGPWLQKPSVFTNACHWIWGEECVQRKKLVSFDTRKYVGFFFNSLFGYLLLMSDVIRIDDAEVYRHEGEMRFSSWEPRATEPLEDTGHLLFSLL